MENQQNHQFISDKQKSLLIVFLSGLIVFLLFTILYIQSQEKAKNLSCDNNFETKVSPTLTQIPMPSIYNLKEPEIVDYKTKTVTLVVDNKAASELVLNIPTSWNLNKIKNSIESQDYNIDYSQYPLHVKGSYISIFSSEITSNTNKTIEELYQSPYGPILGKIQKVLINNTPVIFFNYSDEGTSESHSFQFIHNNSFFRLNLHTPEDPSLKYLSRDIQVVWNIINQLTR